MEKKISSQILNIRFTNLRSQCMSLLAEEGMCIYLEAESILKSERAISLCLRDWLTCPKMVLYECNALY
jgi:hypothetical protein